MKKWILMILCLLLMGSLAACQEETQEPAALSTGRYYIVGDYTDGLRPYLAVDLVEKRFEISMGATFSHRETGSFTVDGRNVTVKTEVATYVFYIESDTRLIMLDNGGSQNASLRVNSVFVLDK